MWGFLATESQRSVLSLPLYTQISQFFGYLGSRDLGLHLAGDR